MKDLNDLLGGDLMGMVGKVQEQMQEAQAALEKVEVEGVSGGGLVKVRASAKGRILGLSIDDSLIVPSDKAMLEDLIVAAFNDARGKADEAANAHMSQMTAGLPASARFQTTLLRDGSAGSSMPAISDYLHRLGLVWRAITLKRDAHSPI